MKLTSRASLVLSLLLPLLGACASSGGKAGVMSTPARFTGFPSQAFAGLVFAEAHFYINHEDVLRGDLIDELGIVPVALKIGLRGSGQGEARVRVSPEDMDLCLYLPDGTPLRSVEYQKVRPDDEKSLERVVQTAFKGSLLEPWERAREEFVFFQLPEGCEYSAKDMRITRREGDVTRVLDLSKSLCTFKVNLDNKLVPFHVGIQPDRLASR